MSRQVVVVVGAGIAGLTTAFRLQGHGVEVVVLEARQRTGGKLRTAVLAGAQVEEGADAFLPRDQGPIELCKELGLEDLVAPAVFGAYLWSGATLRRLPAGFPYGIPSSPMRAWRAGLLSARGALRAETEWLRMRPLVGPDVSIGDFVRDRFGTEVLTNLVDPILAGVRGGSSERISLAAGAKEIDALARSRPSVLRALGRQVPQLPGFLAPRGGMQRLTDALAARVDVRTEAPVRALTRVGDGFEVFAGNEVFPADGVVLAIPAHQAAEVVSDLDPPSATALRKITFLPATVVTVVYPRRAFTPPPDGSGFLAPPDSGLSVSGCTWYSVKWPHAATSEDTIVRCVLGGPHDLDADDNTILGRVTQDLERTCGITSDPIDHLVTRWDRAVPLLEPGHLDRIATIEGSLATHGAVMVTGGGYRGAGIPDCIAEATRTAASMAQEVA